MLEAAEPKAPGEKPDAVGSGSLAIGAVCLAQYLSVLDGFIVSVALPQMGSELRLDTAQLQWIPNAYGLVYAGLLLAAGRLADRFGRTRMFLIGLTAVVVGSTLAAVAPTGAVLFTGRGIQGLGTALSLPAGLGLLVAAFPEGPRRTGMLGMITISGGIGMVSAGALGGLLTGWFGWRSVFWFAIGPAILAMLFMASAARGRPSQGRPVPLNLTDAAISVGGLSLIVYAGSRVPVVGWASPQVWLSAVVGLALLALFWQLERRSESALVDPALLRHRPVRGANLLALIFPVGFVAPQFLGTQVLQGVLGLDPVQTGFAYLPLAVVVLLATPLAGRLTDQVGPGPVAAAGFAILGGGLGYLTVALGWSYWTGFLPATLLAGAGVTAVFVALAVAAVQGVAEAQTGLASGLFNTSQQVGGALVLALTASLAASWSIRASAAGGDEVSALALGLRAGMAATTVLSIIGAMGALKFLTSWRRAGSPTQVDQEGSSSP